MVSPPSDCCHTGSIPETVVAPTPQVGDRDPDRPGDGRRHSGHGVGDTEFQQAGRLDPAAKAAGGVKLARVSMLMLDHAGGDDDFTRKARAAAKPLLRAHLDAEFFRRHTPEQGDAALDFYIDSVFEVVTRAVADERVFRAAMAN